MRIRDVIKINAIEDKRGVSLVIALVLVSIIMIITLNMSSNMMRLLEFGGGAKDYARAVGALESGIEQGLKRIKSLGPGESYGSAIAPITTCLEMDTDNGAYLGSSSNCSGQLVEYWITSSADDIGDSRYIVPPPGEGDAGTGLAEDECRRVDNYNDPDQSTNENILKPCNWNKLYFGETVEIPLYSTDSSGNIQLPVDLGMNDFILKVRTPCADGVEMINGYLGDTGGDGAEDWCLGGRPDLYDANPIQQEPTDVIVNWQIIGYCDYNPGTIFDGPCVGMGYMSLPSNQWGQRSDISIQAINGKNAPLEHDVVGTDRKKVLDLNGADLIPPSPPNFPQPFNGDLYGGIPGYLTNLNNSNILSAGATQRVVMDEPVLRLSVVSSIIEDDFANSYPNIAYIEYQLETDVPIADSAWTVHARGSYGNYTILKKAKKQNAVSNIEFVFQN